jgi:hypothetical protein
MSDLAEKTPNAEPFKHDVPTEDLEIFARFLAPIILDFYRSDEGKAYFAEWQKRHSELNT